MSTEATTEDLISFLEKVRGFKLVADKVLVGTPTMEQIATNQPETWNDIMYLINEWDYSYLTNKQLEQAITTYQQSLLNTPE